MQFSPIDWFGGGFALFTTIVGWIGAVVMLIGCTVAISLGGKQERTAGTIYLVCWLFTTLIRYSIEDKNLSASLVLLIDFMLLFSFSALVWKAPHNWLVWATALQLIVVTLQFLYLINFKPTISAYYTVLNMSSFGIIIAMTVGTIAAWQERAVIGSTADELGRYS